MARETITLRLVARIKRPLAYAGALLKVVGEWLLARAIKVETRGA